jgi:hypothetical protein
MISRTGGSMLLLILGALLGVAAACGQQNSPHTAFVYPAGGRLGSTFEIIVGGQFLDGAKQAFFAGDGVKAEITGFSKPLSQKELDEFRAQLKELELQFPQSLPRVLSRRSRLLEQPRTSRNLRPPRPAPLLPPPRTHCQNRKSPTSPRRGRRRIGSAQPIYTKRSTQRCA